MQRAAPQKRAPAPAIPPPSRACATHMDRSSLMVLAALSPADAADGPALSSTSIFTAVTAAAATGGSASAFTAKGSSNLKGFAGSGVGSENVSCAAPPACRPSLPLPQKLARPWTLSHRALPTPPGVVAGRCVGATRAGRRGHIEHAPRDGRGARPGCVSRRTQASRQQHSLARGPCPDRDSWRRVRPSRRLP